MYMNCNSQVVKNQRIPPACFETYHSHIHISLDKYVAIATLIYRYAPQHVQ